MTVDPLSVERFRRDFGKVYARAFGGAIPGRDAVVGLAVSGGPDSMALLTLATAARPGQFRVATVDHGLRAGAADEAQLVADFCRGLGIAHDTVSPLTEIRGSSLQRRAREARYDALAAWAAGHGLPAILTAHHADDQAETLLMRLNRASGIAGLSGIRPVRSLGGCVLLRPLLDWRRTDLHAVAAQAGVPFVTDPSNIDPRHDRTRIRALLAATPTLGPAALAASAAYLGEAETVVGDAAERAWHERWQGTAHSLSVDDLPRELQRRLIRRAVLAVRTSNAIVRPAFDDASNVEPLLDALAQGHSATQGGVMVVPDGGQWRCRPAPPRRTD